MLAPQTEPVDDLLSIHIRHISLFTCVPDFTYVTLTPQNQLVVSNLYDLNIKRQGLTLFSDHFFPEEILNQLTPIARTIIEQ